MPTTPEETPGQLRRGGRAENREVGQAADLAVRLAARGGTRGGVDASEALGLDLEHLAHGGLELQPAARGKFGLFFAELHRLQGCAELGLELGAGLPESFEDLEQFADGAEQMLSFAPD